MGLKPFWEIRDLGEYWISWNLMLFGVLSVRLSPEKGGVYSWESQLREIIYSRKWKPKPRLQSSSERPKRTPVRVCGAWMYDDDVYMVRHVLAGLGEVHLKRWP